MYCGFSLRCELFGMQQLFFWEQGYKSFHRIGVQGWLKLTLCPEKKDPEKILQQMHLCYVYTHGVFLHVFLLITKHNEYCYIYIVVFLFLFLLFSNQVWIVG